MEKQNVHIIIKCFPAKNSVVVRTETFATSGAVFETMEKSFKNARRLVIRRVREVVHGLAGTNSSAAFRTRF